MSDNSSFSSSGCGGCGCSNFIPALLTSMVGYHVNHGSWFWTTMDFLFWPVAIIKWIIFQEVTSTIIRETFPWFFR